MHTSLEDAALDGNAREGPATFWLRWPAPRTWNWQRILARAAVIAVLLDIALFATLGGLRVRKWAFLATDGAHFKGDVRNAFRWGTAAENEGILNLYDRIKSDLDSGTQRTLDYPPLRLVAAWQWVQWANRNYPGVTSWQDDYEFTRPMLTGNTVAEFASSVLVFLLIRLWTIRMDNTRRPRGSRPRAFRGVIAGMIGAMLFWFNPGVIWVSHCWPQWDVWLAPFFLAAVLLASVNWWFAAGMAVTVGACLKGQMLLGAPVLLLWPLLSLRFGALLRLIAGFFFAAAVIAFPWLKLDTPAMRWCVLMTVAVAAMTPIALRLKLAWWWQAGALVCAVAIAGVAVVWSGAFRVSPYMGLIAAGVVSAAALAQFFPRRFFPAVCGGAVAAIVLLTIPFFNANTNWYTVGFKYGADKFHDMIVGNGVWNIAKMQQSYSFYGTSFNAPDDEVTLPLVHKVVTYRTASVIVYGACMLICGIGAALHTRRRRPDTRFLAAMVAPWLCAVMILTQMHGRYLIWAAGMSALLAGVSVGMAFLGVLVSVVSMLGTMENQYIFVPQYDPEMLRFIQTLDPHVGWMLLTIMLVWMYVAATPRTRWT